MSNKCFSYIRYKHHRQNEVIQTFPLAPTLGGTRKLKPGHMEFSPVSAGKTRQHNQTFKTKTKNPSWPENCLCCGEDHGITIPPHDVRQQYNQQRFCLTITVLPEMALPILWKTTHLSLAHIISDCFDAEGGTSRIITLGCVCAPSFVTRDRFCASISKKVSTAKVHA